MKRLALFAKRPGPGRVKSRLSPALPPDLACDLYRAMLRDALEAVAQAEADERVIYWADETDGDLGLPTGTFQSRVQSGPDLGARLEQAFGELLLKPEDRAIIIGADCPDVGAEALRTAFAALESHDLVLGPTRDGGYYLVCLRRQAPALFRDIPWSTERVWEQTLERARATGLTYAALTKLEDLDTPEDLVRWIGRAAASRTSGLHTQEALRGIGLLPPAPASR